MRPVHKELAEPVARGLLGAASVDGGPTEEQAHIIDALLHGYFDVDTDLTSLEPIDPAGLAAAIEDPKARHRVVELMIVLEFSQHPGSDAMAQRVQDYATALDVDEKMQVVARDALHAARAELNADYQRYHDAYDMEPQLDGTEDAEMAARLRALEHCPPGSLGRAYYDFYQRYGLTFPGEPGGGDVIFVAHDFSTCCRATRRTGRASSRSRRCWSARPTASSISRTSAPRCRCTKRGCSSPAWASLPRSAPWRDRVRPRSSQTRSGGARNATADFAAMDHLSRVDEPLEDVRRELSIPARRS